MSVKRRKNGLMLVWSRWRQGKSDAVVENKVVLTKMKLFSNSYKNLQISDDSFSSVSSASDPENPDQNRAKSTQNPSQKSTPDCDYLAAILCKAPLYKFESEDSGVELQSDSTPVGSEKSFVHSRESSCDSGDSSPDTNPQNQDQDQDQNQDQNRDQNQDQEPTDGNLTEERASGKKLDLGQSEAKVDPETEADEEVCEERGTQSLQDECCRLSQVSPVSVGLSYLQQVCGLMERISRLQRQLCSLKRDRRLDLDRLDFLLQQCSCGAADLVFTEVQERPRRTESLNGTMSDLRTIPETTQRVYASRERERDSWRKRSFTETDARFSNHNLQRRLSHRCSSSWGRVQDLLKTRLRSQARLGHGSFKTSCPQLYRPDLGPVEASVQNQNRNSMMVLGQRPDWTWT